MRAPATMRSTSAVMASRSGTSISENGAHGRRDAQPLFALRRGLPAALRRQAVVLARPSGLALAPCRCEETGALHLMERWVHCALFQLKRLLAPPLVLLDQ